MNNNHAASSAITSLIEGYKKFKKEHFENSTLYDNLVEHGQQPKVLFIACSDSRVDPAIITGCQPGDIFTVRNVANIVPPCRQDDRHHGTSAALEFGVCGLNVSDIVILGHSHCGGIQALMQQPENDTTDSFIGTWMEIATPAKKRTLARQDNDLSTKQQADVCAQESILLSLENLLTFPWIKERVEAKQLALHGWFFNLNSGSIESYNAAQQTFIALDDH